MSTYSTTIIPDKAYLFKRFDLDIVKHSAMCSRLIGSATISAIVCATLMTLRASTCAQSKSFTGCREELFCIRIESHETVYLVATERTVVYGTTIVSHFLLLLSRIYLLHY